jgi:hypothetical protein
VEIERTVRLSDGRTYRWTPHNGWEWFGVPARDNLTALSNGGRGISRPRGAGLDDG